ncbi:MAG: MFS transporter [Parabacteroides sp.]|nr:MFS transporter [Parabacteroides sp.]
MFKKLLNFYKTSAPAIGVNAALLTAARFKSLRWKTFLAFTFGYTMFYICRLSLNVMKDPIVKEGVFTETELGIIGSALFFTYAVGKFANGFLADHCNIRKFLSMGLFVTAAVNLSLGYVHSFIFFAVLWGISGWFQSIGAPSCVVELSRWYEEKERGTFYGIWIISHNLGEGLTWILSTFIVAALGWRFGFLCSGMLGMLGVFIIWQFVHDTPESEGFPSVNKPKAQKNLSAEEATSIKKAQLAVLKNPAIWVLAISSAFMYFCRYAINSWGIFFLQNEKGYDLKEAGIILSINSIFGIIGTGFSGFISDKLFRGGRNVPALIAGLLDIIALMLFLLVPGHHLWIDVLAMIMFGTGIGVLICFLGGLMAVDIAPSNASGAALGVIGIASYVGAGIQDILSGLLIEGNKIMVNGSAHYDFTAISWCWIGAAILSTLVATFVWNYTGQKKLETQSINK